MRESRLYKRISCRAAGYLDVAGDRHDLSSLNISKGGACLRVSQKTWEAIEEATGIIGSLTVDPHEISFSARVCWSSSEDEAVIFGVAFTECDRVALSAVIENLSIEESPRIDSFNL